MVSSGCAGSNKGQGGGSKGQAEQALGQDFQQLEKKPVFKYILLCLLTISRIYDLKLTFNMLCENYKRTKMAL